MGLLTTLNFITILITGKQLSQLKGKHFHFYYFPFRGEFGLFYGWTRLQQRDCPVL